MGKQHIDDYRSRVERSLGERLPPSDSHPENLHRALHYALEGGKRVRAVLVYAAGETLGVALERLDGPACAVELVHAYSLVHDDLPAMDDDDLRRGRPTCHKAFGEATAILVGDALQALAFQVLAQDKTMTEDASVRVKLIGVLAQALGSQGMVGGQALDLAAVGRSLSLAELEFMHILKTGALIRASVLLGALNRSGIEAGVLEKLDHYGKCIGLAFQIRDDILDVAGDTATLGKAQGADKALAKPTYPALLGLASAREHAARLCDDALASLESFGPEADTLRYLAGYIVERAY